MSHSANGAAPRLILVLALLTGMALALSMPVPATAQPGDGDDDPGAGTQGAGAGLEVTIDSGRIRGERVNPDVRVFRGVPFAQPPVGDLRWRAPQPVVAWDEPRDCTAFGPSCVQPANRDVPGVRNVEGRQSEDCLYLNVWTAADTPETKRPVMVWIHGGGNTIGSGSMSTYDGQHLARAGVVLVTINYRLGPFGWFAHPALSQEAAASGTAAADETAPKAPAISGNYGLLDQIAALQWVKRNIKHFGGDPGCVTIFGESAGAVNVARLMVCPTAAGLFHRAICQSGGATGNNRHLTEQWFGLGSAHEVGERVTKTLGCDGADDVLKALRAVPADKLLAAASPAVGLFGDGIKWGPIVDGVHMPDSPDQLWTDGRIHDVPFMAGSNRNEGTMFIGRLPIRGPLAFRLTMRRFFPDDFAELNEIYPVDRGSDVKAVLDQLVTDSAFHTGARYMLRAHEQMKSPAFRYYFSRASQALGPFKESMGAFHGLEIAYVFTTLNRLWLRVPQDRVVSDAMTNARVNFARTGNPNGEPGATGDDGNDEDDASTMPEWPVWDGATDPYMEFGDEIRVGKGLRAAACNIFEARANIERKARTTTALRE